MKRVQLLYITKQNQGITYNNSSVKKSLKSYVVLAALFTTMLFSSCTNLQNDNSSNLKGDYETGFDYQEFVNPSVKYRSFPFYSINDNLEPEEIKRQVRDFKNAGFGGFYLHSRVGLLTEFLSDDWWENIEAAIDAANEVGIEACFYDEDKWPSGYAGGIIPRMGEEYRAKGLVRLALDTKVPEGCVTLKEDDQYRYIMYTAQMGNPKFNGTSWVDLLNPETVKNFIDVSYKPYIEKFTEKTSHYTVNFFADEPHICARYFDTNTPNLGILTYSPFVREKFKTLYGYDIIDKINLLFEEKENWREVRLQYWRTVAQQFDESFTKQIASYCAENGIKFTGHFLGEESLKKIRNRIGNAMLHYRDMQQPGMDHLGLSISKSIITAKSVSSVANQYGTPRRLTEVFGISGQNMNFEDRKWLTGWQTILGINHICPHLTLYSLKGERKRDYPPTFSYHQPYWKHNKLIEDYIARVSYATTVGEYHPQILMIHPLETAYAKGDHDKDYTSHLNTIFENLQSAHFDYDLGDEQIMADTAIIKGHEINIGSMNYAHVILPDMITIRKSTLELLLNLANKGGKIVNIGRFPEFVDGNPNDTDLKKLRNFSVDIKPEEITTKLASVIKPNVTITGEQSGKIWEQLRKTKDGYVLQLANMSHTDAIQFNLKSDFLKNNPVLWNPSTIKCFSLKTNKDGSFTLELAASSNIWITTDKLSKTAKIEGAYKLPSQNTSLVELNKKWDGKRLDPNAITLDFARYSTDNGETFSKPEPVIGIYKRLSENDYKGNLILDYPVQIRQIPKTCQLVVEDPSIFKSIEINNDQVLFNASKNYYLDHKFSTSSVSAYLKEGKNSIRFNLEFLPEEPESQSQLARLGTEIESIYLTGDFAVQGSTPSISMDTQRNNTGDFQLRPVHGYESFTITQEKTHFTGNLTLEGYPFYAGSFELSQDFELKSLDPDKKYYINLPNCESIVTQIEINDQLVGNLTWSPFKADITKLIKQGTNQVKITLTNSLRNLLGPHHQQRGELTRVGPFSFTGSGGFPDPRGESNWYDLRKTNEPMKLWTDTYYFIPFGFLEPVTISISK
ncbi:glycosyl hydrolase [Plebeiibacterium sediminum]|uniref:Glycosyl hydrolase n=1 Tax=Plebeiibacterium sediminum TaxID=2992112 RepID=A0AAE3M2U7_9BACT|nr:glycosyl hydrolase [Plebeiobacterium sediminum]MCW3785946.1 glycosyl hydrolase [Plebeiobacterium sediminum]